MRAFSIICCLFILLPCFTSSQCISADSLLNRIIFLKSSSAISENDQFVELRKYLKEARQCNYDRDSVFMFLLQRTAALVSYTNNFQEAIELTKKSNQLFNERFAQAGMFPGIKIKNFLNLRHFYFNSNNPEKAIEMVDSCINVSLQYRYADQYTIESLEHKSTYQLQVGDYQGCIKTTELSEYLVKIRPEIYSSDCIRLIALFSNKVNALISLQQYSRVENELAGMKAYYSHCSNGKDLGNWYALMGKLRRRQGKYGEAINLFTSSVNYYRAISFPKGESESLDNIGYVYLDNLKDYKRALKYFNEAFSKSYGNEKSNILSNIGNTYVRLNNYDKAFLAFQEAFDNIQPGMNEERLLQSPDSLVAANLAEYLIEIVLDKGNAYFSHYRVTKNKNSLDYAIRIYKTLDQFVNKVKLIQTDVQSKLFWREDVRSLFEHGIEASFAAGNLGDAFYFFENSRAVLLVDDLNAKKILSKPEYEQYFANQVLLLKLEDSFKRNSDRNLSFPVSNLFACRLLAEKFDRVLRKRKSNLSYPVVTLSEVRSKILDKHQAFLELFTGDSAVYTFVITSRDNWLNRIDKKSYDTLLPLYMGHIAARNMSNDQYQHFQDISVKLYSLIFGNIQLPNGRLVVSMDGVFFPFETLVTARNSSGFQYLLDNHPVSYAYSAQYLLNDQKEKLSNRTTKFIGMAPVSYPISTKLNALSGSDNSLHAISEYFSNADNYCFTKASRASFCTNFPKYDIIQLYTHSAYKSDRNEPVLFFSDSALYLSELMGDHRPRTKLIFLAACETGLGENYKGEGVFSFSRGFAAIGIPSSITTLWSVDKDATFTMTELFYKYLAQGLTIDVALQKAKLDFIKSSRLHSLPYYWAAPVLIGNTDPLMSREKDNNIWLLLLSILAAAFIALLAVKFIKKRA